MAKQGEATEIGTMITTVTVVDEAVVVTIMTSEYN